MARTQITLDSETRAANVNPSIVFDLGASAGSDIALNKKAMLAEAFRFEQAQTRPRSAMSLFVDTSVWFAAADRSDRSNARAKTVLSAGEPLVTTDHVLVKTWTLIHHRLGPRAAERFWEGLRTGVAIRLLTPTGKPRRQ